MSKLLITAIQYLLIELTKPTLLYEDPLRLVYMLFLPCLACFLSKANTEALDLLKP